MMKFEKVDLGENVLTIYTENGDFREALVAPVKVQYKYAMRYARKAIRDGHDVPYMRSTNKKLNFWLTCYRMSMNFGFDV